MDWSFPGQLGPLVVALSGIAAALTVIVHLFFAIAVWGDTAELARDGVPTVLANAVVWTLATLMGGVFVAAVYWVLHHTRLGLRGDAVP